MAGPSEEEDAESSVTVVEDPRGRTGMGLMTEGTEVMVSNGSHRCSFFPQIGGEAAGVCPPSSCQLFRQYKMLSSRKQ